MSERRHNLIRRVADALIGLESLAEGKIAKIDPNRVHGGEHGGLQLLRDKSPLEYHTSELESWCSKVEDRIGTDRRRSPHTPTKLEEDYWFVEEWQGRDWRTVADRTGMHPDDVWRKRERLGLNPKDGTALAA